MLPVKLPGCQLKLLLLILGVDPEIIKAEAPSHIVVEPPAATEGKLYTPTSVVAVLLQPFTSVPVTVYTVYDVGVTLQVAVAGPPDQL